MDDLAEKTVGKDRHSFESVLSFVHDVEKDTPFLVVVGISSTYSLISSESEQWGGLWNWYLFIRVGQESARLKQQAGERAHNT